MATNKSLGQPLPGTRTLYLVTIPSNRARPAKSSSMFYEKIALHIPVPKQVSLWLSWSSLHATDGFCQDNAVLSTTLRKSQKSITRLWSVKNLQPSKNLAYKYLCLLFVILVTNILIAQFVKYVFSWTTYRSNSIINCLIFLRKNLFIMHKLSHLCFIFVLIFTFMRSHSAK